MVLEGISGSSLGGRDWGPGEPAAGRSGGRAFLILRFDPVHRVRPLCPHLERKRRQAGHLSAGNVFSSNLALRNSPRGEAPNLVNTEHNEVDSRYCHYS